MHNDLAFDLPLQINNNICNLQKLASMKSKDMPKQIKNDVYRQPRTDKQNFELMQEAKYTKPKVDVSNQKLFQATNLEKSKDNNRSSQLRAIIKKKLFSEEKSIQNGQKLKTLCVKNQQIILKPENKLNRYQMLLSQFYGTPDKVNPKYKPIQPKDKNRNQNQYLMKRHQSVRNINQILKIANKELPLGRYRSQKTLPRLPINSEVKKTRKNSNIKSEISKIPTYLDLYKQKKRLMLTE